MVYVGDDAEVAQLPRRRLRRLQLGCCAWRQGQILLVGAWDLASILAQAPALEAAVTDHKQLPLTPAS